MRQQQWSMLLLQLISPSALLNHSWLTCQMPANKVVVGLLCCCCSLTKQQLPFWVQPASILQQKQTGNTPSSILSCPPPPPLPPPLSSLALTPHCTQVPAAERYNTKNHALWEALQTAGYQHHLSTHHSSIPLLLYSPLLLRLILKAQHSPHACTVEREGKKSDGARKKKRRSTVVSAPQKSPPPPIPTPPFLPLSN